MFSRPIAAATVSIWLISLAGCGTAHGLTEPEAARPERVAELAHRGSDEQAQPAADLVFVRTDDGLRAIKAGDGGVAGAIPEGLAAPHFTSIVSTEFDGSASTVTRTTPTGEALDKARLPGDLEARVVTE